MTKLQKYQPILALYNMPAWLLSAITPEQIATISVLPKPVVFSIYFHQLLKTIPVNTMVLNTILVKTIVLETILARTTG